ncbi:arylsulfatase [Labilibacter sediminis]|nr:arylsulfatase [Labilibacter sediminis]
MSKITSFKFVTGLAIVLFCSFPMLAKDKKKAPNIVFILADDLGYGDVSCLNENSKVQTPNIDKLASEGVLFTDAHANAAVCTPSRYGILTGRYAWRSRLRHSVLMPWEAPLIEDSIATLPEMLKANGYYTACVGKWHLGWQWNSSDGSVLSFSDEERFETGYFKLFMKQCRQFSKKINWDEPILKGPTDVGFDYYFGDDVPNFPPYTWIENKQFLKKPTERKPRSMYGDAGLMAPGWQHEQVMPVITEKAQELIREQSKTEQPFFLYWALTAPHTPVVPLDDYKGKSGAGLYGDFIVEMDDFIGKVLATIDSCGIAENTIIIFTSDNGPEYETKDARWGEKPQVAKYGHESSYVFRGIKRDIWEGGHRVPMIVKWPAKVKSGKVSNRTVCFTDFMATIASMTGVELPDKAAEDSYDFSNELYWTCKAKKKRKSVLLSGEEYLFAIKKGKWKFIEGTTNLRNTSLYKLSRPDDILKDALYNLEEDPGEKSNLIEEYPQVAKELRDELNKVRNGI